MVVWSRRVMSVRLQVLASERDQVRPYLKVP